MNILDIVRSFCGRQGLPRPTLISGNDDPLVIQVLEYANEVVEDLANRGGWQAATYKTTFTTVASENQGALSTLFPKGFRSLKDGSMYNLTTRLPIEGPIDSVEWQAYLALPTGRIFPRYRLLNNNLLMQPNPSAGQTIGVEYSSDWFVQALGSGTAVPAEYFSSDADIFLLPKSIILAGLLWKWNYYKGLSYAEQFTTYETLVADAQGRDGTKKTVNLGGNGDIRSPGIFVPSGNWLVP